MKTVYDEAFVPYGKVITGYDFDALLKTLDETTEQPEDAVMYIPSAPQLEALDAAAELSRNMYGGMPVQLGYCNGNNTKLNCLEYHRDSEVDIPADDIVLLVARQQDIKNGVLDTAKVEMFLCPKGVAVELYATTLHYAPCNAKAGEGFRVVIVLPRGTNGDAPSIQAKNEEDKMLWACNKWLIAHPDSSEASQGAFVGLKGENPDIKNLL